MARSKIEEYYRTILNREPDEAGLDYWNEQLDIGTLSLEEIRSHIESSNEAKENKRKQETATQNTTIADNVPVWQQNYDATTSNFVDDPVGAQQVAIENQMTGILEQKGLYADQEEVEQFKNDAKEHAAQTNTGTLGALQYLADLDAADTAEARGDIWGSSETKGRAFIESQYNVQPSFGNSVELVSGLYTEGFGREPDAEGLQYWVDALESGTMTYGQIAQAFGGSPEAELRDAYHGQYGRDADEPGLLYWGEHHPDDPAAAALSVMQASTTPETALRGAYSTNLGQHSQEEDRQANIAAGGFWTDVSETDLEAVAAPLETGTQTIEQVMDTIEQRGNVMTIGSLYDVDDAEGGSDIGRILTRDEIEPQMSNTEEEMVGFASELGAEQWPAVTAELYKQPGEGGWEDVTFPKGTGAAGVMYTPGFEKDERGTNTNTLSNKYQVPVPPDYTPPTKANVNRQNVNYMPSLDGTVPNRPLRNLDSSVTTAPQQAVRNQGAFVAGTSAKGVRRRQSSAARSGRSALGTKQLARDNMQIKSLNI